MRVGEIVRGLDGDIRQYPNLQPLTVSDLFREAGYPVPDGARLVFVDMGHKKYWQWAEATAYGVFHKQGEWVARNTDETDGVLWFLLSQPDLSRLPAADAWECLPDVIKAVVK